MLFAARWSLLAFASLAAMACEKSAVASPPVVPEVVVQPVEVRDTPVEVVVTGQVRGGEDVEIRARVPGFLEAVEYQEGTLVRQGQLLFVIDARPFAARETRARAGVAEARALFERSMVQVNRLRPLVAQNAVAKQDLDNAVALMEANRGSLAGARAELTGAQLDVSYTRVRSPIDGIAGSRQVDVGSYVGSPQPTVLTVVSSLNPIRFNFHISEAEYLQIARERRARGRATLQTDPRLELQLADGTIHPYKGRITVIGRSVDTETGTLPLEASFPNPGGVLRPGQFARMKFPIAIRRNSILVPQRAVQELQGTYSVFVLGPADVAQVREIKVANRVGSSWVVTEGLGRSDRIVVDGVQKVRAGARVKPVPARPAPRSTAPRR